MASTAEKRLSALARTQHGVFSRRQAIETGWSDRCIDARAERGIYERLHPSVFTLAGSPSTWLRDVIAAVLAVPGRTAASHRTAAHLWEFTSDEPDTIEVVTLRHDRIHAEGFTIHESKNLLPEDLATKKGIRVTTPARTIVDLGASASLGVLAKCLDNGLRTGQFTLDEVQNAIKRLAKPGRNGIRAIRMLVDERLHLASITESALEDLFRSVLLRSGVPLPEAQYEVRDPTGTQIGRFDFAYPEAKALIELDSERWHMDPTSFQRDRDKQNQAHALGWTVYRLTWRQLQREPSTVIRTLAYICAR